MISSTEENYLKAVYALSQQENQVSISDISAYLEVSKPSINSMIKNLQAKALVKYEKYKPIELTAKGKEIAALVVRKHRLTEMYLVNQMGFGWEEVHQIAEQMEHIKSPALFDRMDELMGYPKTDPHGSPIPDKQGKITTRALIPMSECEVGKEVRLVALENSSDDFLAFLNSREISLGISIRLISKEPFDRSITVDYLNKQNEVLSAKVCDRLLVSY
ncbi:MAG: metal-dependent transcriptional regulator [Cyclobacteriaceae bacterium]